MKKVVICLLVGFMAWSAQAQRFDSGWYLSAGFNAVGSLGTRNPVENLGDFAFRTPFAVAIENKWSREFAIEQDLSFNGFKKGKELDFGTPDKTLTYFSTNTNVKWYFTDYIFQDTDWLDVYISAGVGLFTIEELNTSGNFSAGAAYWFSEYFGVRLQTTAKFAVNANNREFDNNHWQHFVQAVFRL